MSCAFTSQEADGISPTSWPLLLCLYTFSLMPLSFCLLLVGSHAVNILSSIACFIFLCNFYTIIRFSYENEIKTEMKRRVGPSFPPQIFLPADYFVEMSSARSALYYRMHFSQYDRLASGNGYSVHVVWLCPARIYVLKFISPIVEWRR